MKSGTPGRGCARAIAVALLMASAGRISAASAQVATGAPATGGDATLAAFGWPLDKFHELETKYIFGFTEGSDIGAQGEKAIDLETTAQASLRTGTYGTVEQEVEFEGVPSQYWEYELSAHGLGFSVNDVDGMANAHGFNFSGLSAKLRYLVIGRGPGSPIGFTLVAEPQWARVDSFGQPITDFDLTLKAVVDTELIPNQLYAAANLIYTPDTARSPGQAWQQTSQYGLTGALSYRVTPRATLGGEVQYYTAYNGLGVQSFQGQALYLGPTLYVQLNNKMLLSAAWSTQVAGHAPGENFGLDLTNFAHQLGNLRLEVEF